MDVKKLALLVGALVIAVITAVMAKNMFAGAGSQQAAAATVPVTSTSLPTVINAGFVVEPVNTRMPSGVTGFVSASLASR